MKKQIAEERIEILFNLALQNIKHKPERAKRYVELLRNVSKRYKAKLPKGIRRFICKKCNSLMLPGYNMKIKYNQREKIIEYACSCGAVKKFRYYNILNKMKEEDSEVKK